MILQWYVSRLLPSRFWSPQNRLLTWEKVLEPAFHPPIATIVFVLGLIFFNSLKRLSAPKYTKWIHTEVSGQCSRNVHLGLQSKLLGCNEMLHRVIGYMLPTFRGTYCIFYPKYRGTQVTRSPQYKSSFSWQTQFLHYAVFCDNYNVN